MQLIDGKAVADRIKQEIAQEVEYICSAGGKRPHLAAVLVGHDGGSETYVAHKVKPANNAGSNRLSFAMKAMLPKKSS